MRWVEVTSVEDLKALGNFREVSKIIKEDLEGIADIKDRSWKGLYDKVIKFRQLLESMIKNESTKEINTIEENYSFFTSKANEYIFYLTELEGDIRMKKLGITKSHFTSKKKSKEWRDKISKEIHPDINHHPKSQDAMAKLNSIYSSMIGKE